MGQYKRKLSKGMRWLFKGQYLGVRYHSKAIYLTKLECSKAERVRRDEIDMQQRSSKTELKLLDLVNKRLSYLQEHKSYDYFDENRRYFRKVFTAWGDIMVHEVSKAMVNDLLMAESKRLKRAKKTNHKANSMLRSLKALFNWGNKVYDLDIRNPCNLDMLPIDITLKYIPPDEELKKVREKCNPAQQLLIDFVEESGCRILEAVRLLYSDIDGELVTLYTRKSKNSDLTPRRIPLPECLKGMEGKGKVFTNWNEYPRFIEEKVKDLKFTAWNWHNYRHRRASIWANGGMGIFEIMSRLGHSNMSTTMKYLQLLGYSDWGKSGERK